MEKKPNPPKKPILSKLPWIIFIVVFTSVIVVGFQKGYFGDNESSIHEIRPPATVGVPCRYDFSDALIPSLNPDWNGVRSGYTFYLGTGVGFPPMGLTLGIDGILSGTPTGKDGTFEVCVKDVGGNSVCKTYHLAVNPKSTETTTKTTTPTGCVINARCGEKEGTATIEGVFVIASCPCPTGTYLYKELGETNYCACK